MAEQNPNYQKPVKQEIILVRTHQSYKKTILIALLIAAVSLSGYAITYEIENMSFFWILVFALGFAYVAYRAFKRYSTLYTLTDSYVQEESGLLNRKVIKIPISRITNYLVERSLIDRLLGLGTLNIDTPGSYGFELTLVNISNEILSKFTSNLDRLLKEIKADSSQ